MKLITLHVLVLTLIVGHLRAAWAQEITFKTHGKLVKKIALAELEKVAAGRDLEVFEPHESKNVIYKSFNFNKILDSVYGSEWKAAEELLFTCVDGYQPSIPRGKFQTHAAQLAYQRVGSERFTLTNTLQNNEVVNLGPFYLIWENIKDVAMKAAGATDLPYQVTTVDLVTFSERFPALAPPAKSPVAAKRGFVAYRTYCMTCHSLNGQGGGKAPELNYPVNVTEYYRAQWLRRWISEPTSVRFNTTMPALPKKTPARETTLDDLVAYLTAMKNHKVQPK